MNDYESFQAESLENKQEVGLNNVEVVGFTNISNFEESGFLTNEDVVNYLKTLPPSHLDTCGNISYEPSINELHPNAKGSFDTTTHNINLYGPTERFGAKEGMLHTLTHEIGHNVHTNLFAARPELTQKWSYLHEQSWRNFNEDGSGFVSSYARTSMYEDFAESYAAYIRDPEELQFYNPEKYEFMRQEVFSGQESFDGPLQDALLLDESSSGSYF